MPCYLYEHPETGKIIEVIQRMNEEHIYKQDGVMWRRVFTNPQAATDTKEHPFSAKDFVEKSAKKKGTVGDLYDKAAELSKKREDKLGAKDPIKKAYWENWSKVRGGKKHPHAVRDGYL
jgi:predicted nucleic acid-binding Zn ribbon protein